LKPSAATPSVIVALSAGLDSTVLLHLCKRFFGADVLLAVHVNHQLQPAAKDFEAAARRSCREWGIALSVCRLKDQPAPGQSIEAWAREARYRALGEVAQRRQIALVLTAHHQDDQLETLLIALSRGAGLDGLKGIAPQRPLEGSHAILHRPLLECSRAELLAYAEDQGLSWIDDPSNQDPRFLRNRLRRDLVPVLNRVLPQFARQATRSMGHLRAAEGTALDEVALSPTWDRRAIVALSPFEQAKWLRAWVRRLGCRSPSLAKLQEMSKQLLHSAASEVQMTHDGQRLSRRVNTLGAQSLDQFSAERIASAQTLSVMPSPVAPAPSLGSVARMLPTPAGWIWPLPQFKGQLLLKNRPGTARQAPECLSIEPPKSTLKLQLQANTPRRTLKNLFQEAGISAPVRRRLPCVLQADQVLYVSGLGTDINSPWLFEFLPDL
jgi:tRNA(Ile)-lysidine synthase